MIKIFIIILACHLTISTSCYNSINKDQNVMDSLRENTSKLYKVGDPLLTLERDDNKLKTYWYSLRPTFDENKGKTNAFKKSK